jgi:predicted DNA-binding protein
MKEHQLRVRLGKAHYTKLQELCSLRKRGETVSDIVRQAIEAYVEPQLVVTTNTDYLICEQAKDGARKLATLLDRKPCHVIEDCVQGILDLHEQQRTPLIVLELKLRAEYFERNKSAAHQQGADEPDPVS